MKTYQTIELGNGATYRNSRYTVYEHSTYPRSSVLAGQRRRVWMDDFETIAEAQAAYPKAVLSGSTYQKPVLHHLPEEGDLDSYWFDENYSDSKKLRNKLDLFLNSDKVFSR